MALGLLPLTLLWDAVLGRAVFYERDILAYWVPGIEAFVRAVAEGAWPLWDPLTAFGRPMLADPNLQLAYPPTWLNLIVPPGAYYTLFVVAHLALAGLGAFRLGRAWGLGLAGAWWAGALWMLSGPLLSLASLFHHFASAAWMAWVLVALEGVLRRPAPRSAAWLGLAAGAMALAGSADMSLMAAVIAVARVAFATASRPPLPSLTPATASWLAAACGLAALLCAVQWWGTIAVLSAGSRGAAGPASTMYWSVHPASLIDAVVPGLVADLPLGAHWRAALYESRGPLLRSLYVGVPALLAALCALAAGRWPLRWLAAALAAAFLVAALGRFTPAYPAIAGLPVLRLLRFPVKYLVPATLMLGLLSGAGVDAFRQEWDGRARRRMAIVAMAALVSAAVALAGAAWAGALAEIAAPSLAPAPLDLAARVRWGLARVAVLGAAGAGVLLLPAARRRAPHAIGALLVLATADLLAAGRGAVRLGPPSLLRHRPPILDALPDRGARRTYVLQYPAGDLNARFARLPAGWDPEWAWALGHVDRLSPPAPTRFGIAGSFDGDFTGMMPMALSRLTAIVYGRLQGGDGPGALRLLRMASVTDVVGLEDSFAGLPPRAERLSVYATPVRVFAVPDPLPRAYLVAGAVVDTAAGEASVVADPAFDPRALVALDASAGRPSTLPGPPAGEARIRDRRSDRLRVDVKAAVPAVLVVTESFDAGWRAWVDGAPAPVWRANAIFRGVPVPAGDHLVEMRYRPPSAGWGAAASLLGAGLALVLMGRRAA